MALFYSENLQASMPQCLINLILQFCLDINGLYNYHISHYEQLIHTFEWDHYEDFTEHVYYYFMDLPYGELPMDELDSSMFIYLEFENALSLYGLDIPMRVSYQLFW